MGRYQAAIWRRPANRNAYVTCLTYEQYILFSRFVEDEPLGAIVFSLGVALACVSFVLPRLLQLKQPRRRSILIFSLHVATFGACRCFLGTDAAFSIAVLAGLLTCDVEALALQYRMVHNPKAPKFTRCY